MIPLGFALLQAGGPEPPHGVSLGGTLAVVALIAIVAGVILLVAVEFGFKRRIPRATYNWLLLIGLLVLPAFALLGSTGSMFEEMKDVESCNSCHVMNAFIDDMRNPESATLAARHFRTGAIPAKQCYSCHTGYGIFGTMEAKRDGFRHWLLYATRTWEDPITFKGSYPNANCLACHSPAPAFRRVQSHVALRETLETDQIGCYTCHGLPHPARPGRTPGHPAYNRGAESGAFPPTAEPRRSTSPAGSGSR
jgi:cytochrome c nitrite reductase small subunit